MCIGLKGVRADLGVGILKQSRHMRGSMGTWVLCRTRGL